MAFPMNASLYNMSTLQFAKICWDEALDRDKRMLRRRCQQKETWYRYIRFDDPNHPEYALLEWAKSTFDCPWNLSIRIFSDHTNFSPCSVAHFHVDTCKFAARNGDLNVLQWAHRNGCLWDARTCASAARNGHLEILQWAHRHHCPWDAWTCEAAAENGHLEILQWAHQNGCPWDRQTCTNAERNGHSLILQWAIENGCPRE